MGAVQKRLAQFGFAKQTAKGSAASAPTYVLGPTGGRVVKADVTDEELQTSWSTRGLEGVDRISVVPGAEVDLVALPKSIGLLLYLALGGVATAGTGPYTHTLTVGNALLYSTFFGLQGVDKFDMPDSKIDELELSWEKTGALRVKVSTMGTTLTFASAWTGGTSERVAAALLKGAGGVFQVDGAAARVVSGSITISNSVEPILDASSTTPTDVFESGIIVKVSLTIIPSDLTFFRQVVTGTAGGTVVQTVPEMGTVTLKWLKDANTYLQFSATNVQFATEFPESDPAGGPVEIPLEGLCVIPSGGGEGFSFELKNDVVSY